MLEFLMAIYHTAVGFFWEYNGNGLHIALFFAALLYLIAAKKEEEDKTKKLIVGYTVLFALIYLCPVTAYIIMKYCIGTSVYWRMFWLLPFNITISYVFVKWLFQTNGKKQFAVFIVAAVAVIVLCGSPVYTKANFILPENEYKIPQSAVEVCELIQEDYDKEGSPKATVPNELLCYIRQYDAGIHMPYGRNALKGEKLNKRRSEIYAMMSSGKIDWKRMSELLKEEESHYFVYALENGAEELEQYGYHIVGKTADYSIYRCDAVE